jgi:hypothetical protein
MSKFTAAMNAVKDRSSAAPVAAAPVAIDALEASAELTPRPVAAARPSGKRRGRPAGKRSRETTVQVTAYVESAIYIETKIKLLQNAQITGEKQDFSELVQQLLADWLKS